ncbi:hypothetical protein RI367_005505 [Sorochytrium milnesiophthora]
MLRSDYRQPSPLQSLPTRRATAPVRPPSSSSSSSQSHTIPLGVQSKTSAPDLALSDFALHELLGTGGFGAVYKATVLQPHRCNGLKEVAIKMIPKAKIKTARLRQRVANEIEIHWQLNHPSVLTLYSFFEDAESVYLVMEICEGGELFKYMHRRTTAALSTALRSSATDGDTKMLPLDESEVRWTLKQIVQGLLYLHGNGIIHRDLKLSNMLLTRDYRIKIADFGLAAKMTGEQKTMCGTPNYISPEVISRLPHGFETDVWSLGCLMYTLLVGRPPFESEQVISTLSKVSRADYHLPDSLSIEARDLISRLLLVDPHLRIRLSSVLAHPFFSQHLPCTPLCSPSVSAFRYTQPRQHEPSTHLSGHSHGMSEPSGLSGLPHAPRVGRPTSAPPAAYSAALPPQTKYQPLLPESRPSHWTLTPPALLPKQQPISDLRRPALPQAPRHTPPTTTSSEALQPLSTARLKPYRQATKHGVVELLASGAVVTDFNGDKYVIVISGDGQQVRLFERDYIKAAGTHGIDSNRALRTYSLSSLPDRYHKKYKYASTFVNLIRSKTPKIVFYSPQAKCILMENAPQADFEVQFYSGTRIVYLTAKNTLDIKSEDGHLLQSIDMSALLPSQRSSHSGSGQTVTVPPEYRELVRHTQDCLRQCLEIERSVKLDPAVRFPLTLKSSSTSLVSGNVLLQEQQQLSAARSNHPSNQSSWSGTPTGYVDTDSARSRSASTPHAAGAVTRTDRNQHSLDDSPLAGKQQQQPQQQDSGPTTVFIRDVGWCTRDNSHANYYLQFLDGISLSFDTQAQVVWYGQMALTSEDGKLVTKRYLIDRQLPEQVKHKLGYFARFVKLMK